MRFHVPTDLSEQALLDHAHERGTSILEAKGHGDITKAPERGDEGSFDLNGSKESDLMVPGIGIQEGQSLTPRSRVDYPVDAGQREMIFREGPIDMLEINAHSE